MQVTEQAAEYFTMKCWHYTTAKEGRCSEPTTLTAFGTTDMGNLFWFPICQEHAVNEGELYTVAMPYPVLVAAGDDQSLR